MRATTIIGPAIEEALRINPREVKLPERMLARLFAEPDPTEPVTAVEIAFATSVVGAYEKLDA